MTEKLHSHLADDVVPLPQSALYLKVSPGKGRGVFAAEPIPSGTMISLSPVLIFPPQEKGSCSPEREVLNSYTYTWGNTQALALGLGSMFNHSKRNNVGFVIDKPNTIIRYFTIKDVEMDTELCINYGPRLWFDDSELDSGIVAADSGSSSEDEDGTGFLSKLEL